MKTKTIVMSLSMLSLVSEAFASISPDARHNILGQPSPQAHAIDSATSNALHNEAWWERNRDCWELVAAYQRSQKDSSDVEDVDESDVAKTRPPPTQGPQGRPGRGFR